MIKEIKLPEIADNVHTAVVTEILVSVGDIVSANSALAEMESDKASFELPSDVDGIVKSITIKQGDVVNVGQVMFLIDTNISTDTDKLVTNTESAKNYADHNPANSTQERIDLSRSDLTDGGEDATLKTEDEPDILAPSLKAYEDEPTDESKILPEVPASPSVRRLARELGVNIRTVKGNGPHGRISQEDVKNYARSLIEEKNTPTFGIYAEIELPDFSRFGPTRREKMDTIRKITARAMVGSWHNIPHVFQFDKADITELEKFRNEQLKLAQGNSVKITVTSILIKLVAAALKTFPKFNASIDIKTEEIIYKEYVNIGVAVDTERGLLVPVIRNADTKTIKEISAELSELTTKARTKKIKPDELQGASFTISNLGGIGGTNFTPVVNSPAVAILGVSRSQIEPVFQDDKFIPRLLMPLTLSYDHRIIDGAEGARFLRWLCEAVQNPLITML